MLWERQHDAMQRYIGTYEGAMIADGTTTVITKLFNRGSSSLEGRYMMIYGHDPHPRVELGLLGPCLLPSPRELFCVWLDRGGIGFVSMLFNARADEFKGMYTLYGRTGLLQRMEPAFWNQMTDWNGKLR